MTIGGADSVRPSVSCGNCGRVYGPADGIRFLQYSGASLVALRSLFANHLRQVPCPACATPIDFEPGILVAGIDPPAAYICGGDALTNEQLAGVVRGIEQQAAADGIKIDIQSFGSQVDLRSALYERLKTAAGAMTPLNAANVQGKVEAFLAANWRTITPEVLVASDVVTMVQRVLSSSDEGREAAEAYFAKHADALGHIQAWTWRELCRSRGRASSPAAPRLEHDLSKFVDPGVLFQGAISDFERMAADYQREDEHHPLVAYCMLALLARVRKVRGEPNALADEWSSAWMSFELMLRSPDTSATATLEPLALSREAIADTLRDKTLFDIAGQALGPHLKEKNPAEVDRIAALLDQIAEKAGYGDLASDLPGRGIVLTTPDITTAAEAIAELDARLARPANNDATATDVSLEFTVDLLCSTLVANADTEGIQAVFNHALPHAPDDNTRAELEAWYGATLLRLHQEQLFLGQVGADERDWEVQLPDGIKGRLWTERANALRATGRFKDTLEWRKRVVPLYASRAGSRSHRQSLRMLAMAERETGAPDRALELILPLLEDKGALDRIHMLDTAAAIWFALGDRPKADAAIEEAVQLAVGPDAHLRERFTIMLASIRVDTSAADTERALLAGSRDGSQSPATLLQECAAWFNLRTRGHEFSAEAEKRYPRAIADLRAMLEKDVVPAYLREPAYILLAEVAEQHGSESAHQEWGMAADVADALGLVPRPEVVIALARHQYRSGQAKHGRAVLRALPSALARTVQEVERIDVALGAMTDLGGRLDAFTDFLLDRDHFHDARAVAEFRRDPLRRAISGRDVDTDATEFLSGRLFAPVVRRGAVVLEFLKVTDGLVPIITWPPPGDERAQTRRLSAPQIDVFELRDRVVNKLQGWVRGRPGDPFNVKDWPEFRSWLGQSLADTVPESGHLVVIESEGIEGLPFHVAVAPEWTCSYASSWTSLARAVGSPTTPPERLGFAMVPAFADDVNVSTAMRDVGESLRGLARRVGLAHEEAIGAACDQRALSALLATSDISFVACHGFLDQAQNEVAWVLAHDGGLPGKSGVLVSEDEQHPNHVSWRQIERLARTPRIVVSAACSSGRALVAGLGDRIGLYQSLARRGTRTLIAPAWDIEADLVLPIAARALQLHLEEHLPLAVAVRAASMTASETLPGWCAWALSIEGEWQ